MINDPELYCTETSSIPVAKLAALRHLRARLDAAIDETKPILKRVLAQSGTVAQENPFLAREAYALLPPATRRAMHTIYLRSAVNRLEFGDVVRAAIDYETSFALQTPNLDEFEQYLRTCMDAERASRAFMWAFEAFGDIEELRFITDCYQMRHAVRASQIDDYETALKDMANTTALAARKMASAYATLDAETPEVFTSSLEFASRTSVSFPQLTNKAKNLLPGCGEIVRQWKMLVTLDCRPERTLRILQKVAAGRPLFITTLRGRGWLFSHMISQIDWFTRDLDSQGIESPFIVVLNPDRFANEALTRMYRREMILVDRRHSRLLRELFGLYEYLRSRGSPIARSIDRVNEVPHIRDFWRHRIDNIVHGLSRLSFTAKEQADGRALLASLGVPEGAPFACFGVREDKYYRNAWTARTAHAFPWLSVARAAALTIANGDALQGNFNEMQSIMGVKIDSYAAAIRSCTERGIYMIRIGTDVEQSLPFDLDNRVIDYATHHRTEAGDLYLMAHCRFFLSGATGIYTLGLTLKRPVVVSDYYLLSLGFVSTTPNVTNILLPRLYRYEAENRFLTFGEILECDRRYQRATQSIADGVTVMPSTPEDILDAVEELNRQIDGTWVETSEDRELHERVLALYQPYHEGYGMNARISTAFLRKHLDIIK